MGVPDDALNPIALAIKFLEATITGERPDLGPNGSSAL
jgi:hypothetical protein